MQSSTTSSYARYRLLSSVGGKLADALGVIIAIRTLSVSDYGVIGTAMGLMAVIGFVNLTPEDILWRDLPRLRDRLGEHLSAFVWFWLVKLGVVAAVAAIFCVVYGLAHQSWAVAGTMFLIVVLQQILTASPLIEVPLFAGLRQQRGAAFVLGVRVLWLVLLAANFWLRSLAYYLVALLIYATVTAAFSAALLHRHFGVSFRVRAAEAWQKVRAAAFDFTLWLHLVGRARVFLQRGDLAILGWLGVTLAAVGQYAVAINLVSFALILPGVLENVAAVSFAHHPEQRTRNLRQFYGVAAALAAMQFIGGILCGRFALRLLHVADVEASYRIFVTLLGGVSGLVIASPSVAYAMCFRKMRPIFSAVFLPAAVVFALVVWLAAWRWGLAGAATAHAAVTVITGVAVIGVVMLGHDEPSSIELAAADVESVFQE
jgi:hypothetical protein